MGAMGLIYGSRFEDIDHLAPLIEILKLTLFVTDEKIEQIIKHFYPAVNVRICSPNDLGKALLKEGKTLISCIPTPKIRRLFGLEEMLQKRGLHTVFLPHGYSQADMTKGLLAEKHILVFGRKMVDQLYSLTTNYNFKTLVSVGNYRFLYFKKNLSFLEKNLEPAFLEVKEHRALFFPTLLETPEHVDFLRAHLKENWKLFVKYHAKNINDPVDLKIHKDEKIDTPYIYPYLEKGALFVVEDSSVVYDALFFNTPTFFFKDHPELDTLGIRFEENLDESLKKVARLQEKKKEILPYAFDLYPSLEEISNRVHYLLKEISELDDSTY
ncbi:MAG: hypothetical protein FJZ61_04230 [Chlamydiae bacterium]|nr:hypothetical protein [Chlamydiota bacterium]